MVCFGCVVDWSVSGSGAGAVSFHCGASWFDVDRSGTDWLAVCSACRAVSFDACVSLNVFCFCGIVCSGCEANCCTVCRGCCTVQ